MKRFIIAVIGIAFVWGCAGQQDVIFLDNRLSRLEIKNAEMEKDLKDATDELESRLADWGDTKSRQELDLRSRSASLHVEIDSLKENLRNFSGRLEEIEHRMNHGAGGFEKNMGQIQEMTDHNNERLLRLERYLNLEPMERKATISPAPVDMPPLDRSLEKEPADARDAEKELSDIDLYMVAKKAFDHGDYERARQGFQDLLRKFPESQRADNAQFWYGETYYQEKWYEKAILEYQKVVEKYPKGNKVAAALLKQGFSFLNLGDKSNARLVFREVVNKHPNSNEAAVAKKKIAEI
jgi:tol-pal system protein YbgF